MSITPADRLAAEACIADRMQRLVDNDESESACDTLTRHLAARAQAAVAEERAFIAAKYRQRAKFQSATWAIAIYEQLAAELTPTTRESQI